jgi:hypothetical protein
MEIYFCNRKINFELIEDMIIASQLSLRDGHSFLCLLKEKKRRMVCATPLRKGAPLASVIFL